VIFTLSARDRAVNRLR